MFAPRSWFLYRAFARLSAQTCAFLAALAAVTAIALVACQSLSSESGADEAKAPLAVFEPGSLSDTTVSHSATSLAVTVAVSDSSKVSSVTIGGVSAKASGRKYRATIDLVEGVNKIAAIATDTSGNADTARLVVTRAKAAVGDTVSDTLSWAATDRGTLDSASLDGTSLVVASEGTASCARNLAVEKNAFVLTTTDSAVNKTVDTGVVVREADSTGSVMGGDRSTSEATVEATTREIAGKIPAQDLAGADAIRIGGPKADSVDGGM